MTLKAVYEFKNDYLIIVNNFNFSNKLQKKTTKEILFISNQRIKNLNYSKL